MKKVHEFEEKGHSFRERKRKTVQRKRKGGTKPFSKKVHRIWKTFVEVLKKFNQSENSSTWLGKVHQILKKVRAIKNKDEKSEKVKKREEKA